MAINLPVTLLKFGAVVAVYACLSLFYATIFTLFLTWSYQYVIAFLNGVKVVPTMDAINFMDDEKSRVNFFSVMMMDKMPYDFLKSEYRK